MEFKEITREELLKLYPHRPREWTIQVKHGKVLSGNNVLMNAENVSVREVTPEDEALKEKLAIAMEAINEIKKLTAGFGDEGQIPHYWRDELLWRCHGLANKALAKIGDQGDSNP